VSYTPVLTDEGLEIRDKNGTVIWVPSETYSWPPNEEMMEAVFEDASISQPTKDVFRMLVGLADIDDERTNQSE